MHIKQQAQEIISYLQQYENKANQAGMKRFAIGRDNMLGVNIPVLRAYAKTFKKNPNRHALAMHLYTLDIHEVKLLATMIADPAQFTPADMDAWAAEFYSWDICDQACANIFCKTPYYLDKAFEYCTDNREFVKRTGFVLMVQYTVHAKKQSDEPCLEFLRCIVAGADDERNFVKKAINWCLRQIGKRNASLYLHAVETAKQLLTHSSAAAKWIAHDALRELYQKNNAGLIKP